MQIPYEVLKPILEYRQMVKDRKWKFPDYSKKCPICGGVDCPVRIGYYYRFYVDIQLGIMILIPIARYMCLRKARPLIKDRTFLAATPCINSILLVYKRFGNVCLRPGTD